MSVSHEPLCNQMAYQMDSSDVSEFTDMVTSFIAMLATIDRSICITLNARTAAYNSASYGQLKCGVLRTTASGERSKEEGQRQSGGADRVVRHQTPMARAMDDHGLPGQNHLNSISIARDLCGRA